MRHDIGARNSKLTAVAARVLRQGSPGCGDFLGPNSSGSEAKNLHSDKILL